MKQMIHMEHIKPIGKYLLLYSITLVYLELLLRLNMDGGITINSLFFLCFVPAQALFLTLFNGFFKDRKNIIVSSGLLLFLEIYYIAQLIYYKNFGSLFSASMMGMGTEALGNFGWTLTEVIRRNTGGILLMLLPAFIVGIVSFFRHPMQDKIALKPRLILLVLVVPTWLLGVQITRLNGTSLPSAYAIYHDPLTDTDTSAAHLGAMTTTTLELFSEHVGSSDEIALTTVDMSVLLPSQDPDTLKEPIPTESPDPSETEDPITEDLKDLPEPVPQIYEEIDLLRLAEETDNTKLQEVSLFLDSRGATETNKYTGMFEGYNLIYICAESLWSYAIDERVTPTLYKMANQGIVLNNYYNSFKNTTTNGEFAFATSLWPEMSRKADCGTDVGSFPQSATCFMPMGAGDLFQKEGVPAYAFHNYYGEYYRRYLSWPNLGYSCKFMGRTGMKFTSSWPASDLELMEQSVDDYLGEDRFHAYYMTFSGHGPYSSGNAIGRKNIDFVRENISEEYSDAVAYYLAGNRELDLAMEYLLERLEEAGKLENTVIVITGDHYPYNLSLDAANELAGRKLDTDFEIYKSTCIIYNAGMEEPIVTDTYCSNVDILPTILNLFAIPYDSRLLMGRDIFANCLHKAVIYNKSFITDYVQYDRKSGMAEWSDLADDFSDEQKEEYINTMNQLLDSEFYVSTQILSLNYYQYAWYQSGLMTDEELAAEKKRAAGVAAENERYNEAHRQDPEEEEPQQEAEPAPEEEPAPVPEE